MEREWRPIAELKSGRYAVGRLVDGGEADIYRAGRDCVWDVATGETIAGVTAWRRRDPAPSIRDKSD
jgi:hypothetical protein